MTRKMTRGVRQSTRLAHLNLDLLKDPQKIDL